MGNNFLNDLLKQTEEFKKMQSEIEEGKIPDIKGVLSFVLKLPQEMEEATKTMSKEDQEKMKPLLDQIKKEASLENILSKIDAD